MVKEIKFKELEEFIQAHKDHIILVDFWAPWCGPCAMQGKTLEDLTTQLDGKKILIVKVNIDEDETLSDQYHIEAVPTLMFYKDGTRQSVRDGRKKMDRLIGARDQEELLKIVKGLEK